MRIVIVAETFAVSMGYIENYLPEFLGREGHEVHLVVSKLPPYFFLKDHQKIYQNQGASSEVETFRYFTVHKLEHQKVLGYVRLTGLVDYIQKLQPDVVQCVQIFGWSPFDVAVHKMLGKIKAPLFTGCNTVKSHLSSSAIKERIMFMLKGLIARFVTTFSEKCFCVTEDSAEIAMKHYGVPRSKIFQSRLGVDTDLFAPVDKDQNLLQQLLKRPYDLVCCYSGKLTERKSVVTLCEAIQNINATGKLRAAAIVVGNGPQKAQIETYPDVVRLDFMDHKELPKYYNLADVGVWSGDESISILDMLSCAKPLVVSDLIHDTSYLDGCGEVFRYQDAADLASKILSASESSHYSERSQKARQNILERYSWSKLARDRLEVYHQTLKRPFKGATGEKIEHAEKK